MKYGVIIEGSASKGYSAYAPDLPGCVAAADTLEELRRLMSEGIELHIQGLKENGFPVPPPSAGRFEFIEVSTPTNQ